MKDTNENKFSLVIGGPFYQLQQRLRLLGPDNLPTTKTAILFSTLAWLPLAVLSMTSQLAWGNTGFFLDFGAHSRFLIAILMFTIMEPIAERRIAILIQQFSRTGIIKKEQRNQFNLFLTQADCRSGSTLSEIILLVIAYLISIYTVTLHLSIMQSSWLGMTLGGNTSLTSAGWWTLIVSSPLFFFLLLRWLWRFLVWTILLRNIAKLELQIVATHPDRCGGIGFVEIFPVTFTVFVFALSCVTASVVLEEIVFGEIPFEMLPWLFILWLLIVLVLFVMPLAVFWKPLSRLKEHALLECAAQIIAEPQSLESDKLVQNTVIEEDDMHLTLAKPSHTNLADDYDAIQSMMLIPVSKEVFVSLLLASGLPWLVVVATQVPLVEIFSMLVNTII